MAALPKTCAIHGGPRGLVSDHAAQQIDYASLVGTVEPAGMVPGDLDFIFERKGRFLVCEVQAPQKSTFGHDGQLRMLWSLAGLLKFTVLRVEIEGNRYCTGAYKFEPVRYSKIEVGRESKMQETCLDDFRDRMQRWFAEEWGAFDLDAQ